MAGNQKKDSDWGSWALIIILFAVGLSPLALLLLFVKLFAPDRKQQKAADIPPLRVDPAFQAEQNAAASQRRSGSRTKSAARNAMKSPAPKKSNAKVLMIVGAILAFAGLAAFYEPIDMMLWLGYVESYYVEDLISALAVFAGGGGMFYAGLSMDRALKRYGKYLAVMGSREAIPVEELSRTLGYPVKRVEKDLEKMIDKGYFGGSAYLNVELGYLFRSGQAEAEMKQERRQAQTAQEPPKEAEEGYSGILRNIRRANDAIADPVLSAKIDRLEDITAKIFRAVEEDPRKAERIDTFLNYYLPTTQKLLDSYAQFEAAGVEGENLKQAKARIEKTMDSIVAGFEHQLDALYQADVMDVDSDIRVMETMLGRDTASVEKDFGLGDAAAQRRDEP